MAICREMPERLLRGGFRWFRIAALSMLVPIIAIPVACFILAAEANLLQGIILVSAGFGAEVACLFFVYVLLDAANDAAKVLRRRARLNNSEMKYPGSDSDTPKPSSVDMEPGWRTPGNINDETAAMLNRLSQHETRLKARRAIIREMEDNRS